MFVFRLPELTAPFLEAAIRVQNGGDPLSSIVGFPDLVAYSGKTGDSIAYAHDVSLRVSNMLQHATNELFVSLSFHEDLKTMCHHRISMSCVMQ